MRKDRHNFLKILKSNVINITFRNTSSIQRKTINNDRGLEIFNGINNNNTIEYFQTSVKIKCKNSLTHDR